MNNAPNTLIGHAKAGGDFDLRQAILAQSADQKNIRFAEFGRWIPLTRSRKGSPPALLRHILKVFKTRPRPQMSRVYAWGIIARVANIIPLWNWAIVQAIAYAIGLFVSALFVADLAVAIRVSAPLPFPTVVRAAHIDFCPKAIFERSYFAFGIMTWQESCWLAFDVTATGLGLGCHSCWLSTAALTKFWGRVRGIMEGHRNLPFFAKPGAFARRCQALSIGGYYRSNYGTNRLITPRAAALADANADPNAADGNAEVDPALRASVNSLNI